MVHTIRFEAGLVLLAAVALGCSSHAPEEVGTDKAGVVAGTLTLTAPTSGATVQGSVTVSGLAPGFVNVEVWDASHTSPPLARATPAADGTFTATVDTTALTNGVDSWTVWAWNVPAGQPATQYTSQPLPVTIANVVSSAGLPYMIGYDLGNAPGDVPTVQSWLGRPLDLVGTTITTVNWMAPAPYVTAGGQSPLVEVIFPFLSLFGESNDLNDMAQAADGGYDAVYTSMAQTLAAWPDPLLAFRAGHEMNGNWYPWSVGVGTNATYANYIAAFRRVAQIVKQYNPHALAEWCVNYGSPDPTPYWPGAYDPETNPGGVDVISIDTYEAFLGQSPFGPVANPPVNLEWLVTFAQEQGVKIALSEYGAGNASSGGQGSGQGANDGAWVSASIAWMNSFPPGFFLWQSWSGWEPADDLVEPGTNPAEQAAWVSAWGGTQFGGSWWNGAAPPTN